MDNVQKILCSDLGTTEKLIALALVTDTPVEGIGVSGKSVSRHEKAAREFVEGLGAGAPEAPVRQREKVDPDAWLRAQEEDLRESLKTKKPLEGSRDPYGYR
jgi:hypothetical protein